MPPKKPPKKRESTVDWSWVGTEVTKKADITLHHRKRAAGLIGGDACPPRYFPIRPTTLTLDFDDTASIKSESSIQFVGAVDNSGCSAKRCKGWHLCLNHLGGEEVADKKGKAMFIEEKLGEKVMARKGPAGLRNLGATCYANAFLQLWFHNIAFRNGVYESLAGGGNGDTALHHLGLVFASLGKSDRAVVNPEGLINKLKLEKGNQQDAQEFSQLFINMINSEFQRQPNPGVRTLISDLFKGSMRYTTICEGCKFRSERDEDYSELTINIKNNFTLEECLDASMTPERLDGSNKYQCPRCQTPQSAIRKTKPIRLPPILHIALLRFTYDPKEGTRKKSSAYVKFGKETVLGGSTYELKGIIEHEGTSAHHGHFICETFDEESGKWYIFNDEQVRELPKPKKKKECNDPDEDPPSKRQKVDEMRSSKNAYMLVYQQRGFVRPTREPPLRLLEAVEVDDEVLAMDLDQRAHKYHVVEDDYCQVNEAKEDVLKVLQGNNHIVPREQLQRFLKQTNVVDLFFPWDFGDITCEHGGFHSKTLPLTKLISSAAFDKLQQYALIPDLQVCTSCTEEGFQARMDDIDREEQVETFDLMNQGKGTYVLPRQWLSDWKTKTPLSDLGLPTSEKYTLWCDHDNRYDVGMKIELVAPEALILLQSIVGEFKAFSLNEPMCGECALSSNNDDEARQRWRDEVRGERKLWNAMKPSVVFGEDYYVLPRGFMEGMKRWRVEGGERAVLSKGICDCGGVDYDPKREEVDYVSEAGWKLITEKYGDQLPVIIRFTGNPVPGSRTSVESVQPKTCEECRVTRLRAIPKPLLYIVQSKDIPGQNTSTRRRGRANAHDWCIEFERDDTVKDIKVEICGSTKISPISQKLFYRGRELRSEEKLVDVGVLHMDEIVYVEIKEEGEPVDERVEGFGGTALLGLIACPTCTYENEGGATACGVCESPFAM